jgi:hypothetical protein
MLISILKSKFMVIIMIILFVLFKLLNIIKTNLYYFPSTEMVYNTNNQIKDVYIVNKNNDRQHAWYYDSGNSKVILYCHGNAGNISYRKHIIQKCINHKISMLLFDYRGFGNSEGSTTIESTYDDTVDWMNYLINNENKHKNDIVAMGESIGSFPAAKISVEHGLNKLIILGGFHSISDVVNNTFPSPLNYIASYMTRGDLDTGKYLQKNKGDVLILHSKTDEIISFQNAILNSKYGGKLVEISGGHNDHNVDYDMINNFIA